MRVSVRVLVPVCVALLLFLTISLKYRYDQAQLLEGQQGMAYPRRALTGLSRSKIELESRQIQNVTVAVDPPDSQARRLAQVQKVCARSVTSRAQKDFSPDRFFHLYVNDNHKFIYCEVPKVACTNWKRILLILSGQMNTTDPMALPADKVHDELQNKYLRKLSTYTSEEIQYRLENYFKFIFVRNPLERLLSAYKNKFTLKYNTYFHTHYGQKIIKRFRKNPSFKSLLTGSDVSFPEFIHYLLDPVTTKRDPFNAHWRQFYQLCLPCVVNYNFIGKFDTLDSDISSVLQQMHVDHMVHFPPRPYSAKRPRTADILRTSFANISSEEIHKLWELYSVDFAMFGYEYPDLEEAHY